MSLAPKKQVSVAPSLARTAEEISLLSDKELVEAFASAHKDTVYIPHLNSERLRKLKDELLLRLTVAHALVHIKKKAVRRKVVRSIKPKILGQPKAKANVAHKK